MDKSHTWVVCMFDDFDKLDRVPDEYQEAPPQEYKPMVGDACKPQPERLCGFTSAALQSERSSSMRRPDHAHPHILQMWWPQD